MTLNERKLLLTRYCLGEENPEAVYARVAEALALGDSDLRGELEHAMRNKLFFPNSPAIRNAGQRKGMLHACFALPIDDSIQSIFNTVSNMARIFQRGGGVGINFSALRPTGSGLSSGGSSSGAVSFMGIFDQVTETVKQGGYRRGALMGILNHDHPEVLEFARAKLKGALRNFNISVMVTDKFMEAVESGGKVQLVHGGKRYASIKARDVLDLISFSAWCCGDPGLLFRDRINVDNPYRDKFIIDTTNPCSEVALPHYGACCLGSINLSELVLKDGSFDSAQWEKLLLLGTRALLNMNAIGWYPLPEINEAMHEYNPIGLGVMGFADALIKMGVKYDSEQAVEFLRTLEPAYTAITNNTAPNSLYRRIIAPTGSLSILGDCSSGIEPVFDRAVDRVLSNDLGTITERRGLYSSEHVRCAHEIPWEWHLRIQSEFQRIVDGGISKTINLPNETSVEEIRKIYIEAWKEKVKGVTVFRDGCKEGVLRPAKCDGEECVL